jgi:hypothetical protein
MTHERRWAGEPSQARADVMEWPATTHDGVTGKVRLKVSKVAKSWQPGSGFVVRCPGMSDAVPVSTDSNPSLSRRDRVLAAAIGLVAVAWFLMLSGWLGVKPGSVMVNRQNVLFNSDASIWLGRMIGNEKSPEQAVHPLEIPFWRPPCRALSHLLGLFLPQDSVGVLAARLLVALVAGAGVGFMAFAALRKGVEITSCILLFVMYLLFTTNTTVALPEHFGISNGLLSITFVVAVVVASARLRAIVLGALTILCGGTTITNVFFPLGSMVHFYLRSMRLKLALLAAAIPVGALASFWAYRHSYTISWFFNQDANWRLFRDPLQAAVYALYALVCPAVGPNPLVMRIPGWDMVSYEPVAVPHLPVRLSYYFQVAVPSVAMPCFPPNDALAWLPAHGALAWLPALGAAAWLALLLTCCYHAFRDQRTRFYAWLPLGWLLFNVVFHNIWGAELMQLAPHWSWALMGLVILGARPLSPKVIAALMVPIVAGQIYSLLAIKGALLTIVR